MPRWTPEARQQQAERIRALCPWTKSTGPRTDEGKAKSARNAWKGGVRAFCAQYSKILRDIATTTSRVFSSFCRKRTNRPLRPSTPKPQPVEGPLTVVDHDFPPDPEIEELSTDDFIAMAGRLMGGGGLLGGDFV